MPIKWPYLILIVFFLITFFYVFYPKIENWFVFFPQTTFDLTPNDFHLNFKEVYFNSDDGKRLHGWFFPLKKSCPVILFCHGNAGNISHRLDNIRQFLKRDIQVFIFDYRGYGKSLGTPSEKGIYMDGQAAYDYLVHEENIAPENIILFGRSLGAAVAIDVALNRSVKSIIIESAFVSTKAMAKTMFPLSMISFILPLNYNNLEKITHISVPKLIIHGDGDEIVPFFMGKKLFDASKEPRFFYPIKGARHNDTYINGGHEYFGTIISFVRYSRI